MKKNILLILLAFILGGCAAVGVPTTSNPIEKLQWAKELYSNQGRPLPAEKLINEAIVICKQDKDSECLGKAYLIYGDFLRSPSIRNMHINYKKHGFLNSNITFENRLIKSKEYFEKAIPEFLKTKQYDLLTTVYLNIGFAHYLLKDSKSECEAYKVSIKYNTKNLENNPNVDISLPKGFSTYKEYVKTHQKRAGCL